MESRTQERVEQWDSRPFSGGYDGLSELADGGFSGAVTTGATWLFMLNGRIIGVFGGDIEAFADASGTIYQAPHPSLPLLCTMDERGGDTRAKYYTNETPLREVDETLQAGSFTGYVELSENVLSGDYYAVYYGGRRMAAAYIGSAERLLTGDEAFERADDEVGIYEVIDVEIDVTDVPGTGTETEAANESTSSTATDSSSGAAAGSPSASSSSSASPSAAETAVDADTDIDSDTTAVGDHSSGADGATADPTDTTIEPIDISGSDAETGADADSNIESITGDVDTGNDADVNAGADANASKPSGITADPEDVETTAASSAGITDEDASGVAASSSDADSGTTTESTDVTVEHDEDAAVETGTETGPTASDAEADPGNTTNLGDGPDPAEVEAAAEQLDRNDISWTEDDIDESGADATDEERPEPSSDAEAESSASADVADGAKPESELEERFEEEEQWRETRSIPSIDPDHSERTGSRSRAGSRSGSTSGSGSGAESGGSRESTQNTTAANRGSTTSESASSGAARSQATASSNRTAAATNGASQRQEQAQRQRIEKLADRIERLEDQREALEAKNEELVAERDRLREKNQQLSTTVERMESRIEELESELDAARAAARSSASESSAAVAASTHLSPDRALAGTNLFVRYVSKSQPTLESAHDGDADRSEVAGNLQLEHHTEFDASDVAVEDVPYEEFLTSTIAYRFVDWLTDMAIYEIRDTGHASGLADLYDAIPRIDRAELDATISLAEDDTEDVPEQVTFDVVAFDKMGNPLIVATLNDSRQPVTEGALAELEERASAVKANYPDLAAAMGITSSYFESGAHEVVEQATSGGFLSRSSKLSYVSLSRKQGYHLCLVESRSEGFHMTVPEL